MRTIEEIKEYYEGRLAEFSAEPTDALVAVFGASAAILVKDRGIHVNILRRALADADAGGALASMVDKAQQN